MFCEHSCFSTFGLKVARAKDVSIQLFICTVVTQSNLAQETFSVCLDTKQSPYYETVTRFLLVGLICIFFAVWLIFTNFALICLNIVINT